MNCNTQKGLYYLIIGSIITMTYGLIASITGFFTQGTTASMAMGVLSIVSLIGAIILLIGVILFLFGKREFGEKHQNNVKNAVIIFCINLIVVVILASAVAFIAFSAVTTSSLESVASPFSILIVIIAIISAVLGGLMYYFALIDLEDERGKNILYAGIISSIIISVITSFYIAGMLGELFGSIPTTSSSYSSFGFTQNAGKIGILGIIPNLLFLYAFYIPYKRIKDGELVPILSSSGQGNVASRMCPNCNKNIPDDANICPYCGKQFESYL